MTFMQGHRDARKQNLLCQFTRKFLGGFELEFDKVGRRGTILPRV